MNLPDTIVIPPESVLDRADKVIAVCLEGAISRSSVAQLIRQGRVLVDDRPIRPSTVLKPGDRVRFIEPAADAAGVEPEPIPTAPVLHEDRDIIVVDKPPGLVVHPGAGRPSGTLMDELIRTRQEMVGVGEAGRWGVVHRLDRDTSGVLVVAKTANAHAYLSRLFKEHSVHRVYLALVRGTPHRDTGIVEAPLGRHSHDRKRISTSASRSRPAVTRWKTLQRYGSVTLLEVTPETGRTHQIRVHLSSAGLPVLGDQVYGKPRKTGAINDPVVRAALAIMKRQALHAAVLGFDHPAHLQYVEFASPMPPDMQSVIRLLQGVPDDLAQ